MSNDCEREPRKDPASVLQPKAPEVCAPEPEGRLDTLWPIDLGEFVVGSEHEVSIRAPRNLHGLGATGLMTVEDSCGVATAITGSWENPSYDHGKPAGPFRFKYKPEKAGIDRATLNLTVRWADGHVEHRVVQVIARARAIDAVPGGAPAQAQSKPSAQPREPRAPDSALTKDENVASLNIEAAHAQLMKQQLEGISVVEREAARFKPKPAPKSIWQVLADLAITVGTGAIASVVSKYVGERLAGFLVDAKAKEAQAKSVATANQLHDQRARDAAEGPIIPTPTLTPQAAAATHERAIENFSSGRIQAAVTGIFNSAAATATSHDSESDERPVERMDASSRDKEIAFFSAQRSMQNQAATQSVMHLNTLVGEILKTHPQHGPDIVTEMTAGFSEAASTDATSKQANATSAQFATYVARTKLGTQNVETGGGDKTVTNLDGQRKFENPALTPGLAAGVLEIEVSRDAATGAVQVTHARINNVSWLVADRLLDLDLRTAGVPLRINVNHGATLITRDESGRVRVGGSPLEPRGPNPGSEAQNIHEAERIAHAALGRPLRALNPDIQLVTNDANQPRSADKDPA